MNKRRDLQLAQRQENIRDKSTGFSIIHFESQEIISHFDTNMDAIRSQFNVADELVKQDHRKEAEYIWRSQIVFCVNAIDFYMHEITKYGMNRMFRGDWNKTSQYNKLKIPMKNVEMALKSPESLWLIECVNGMFASSAFGSADSINRQLQLIGIAMQDVTMKAFYKQEDQNGNPSAALRRIDAIWERRNQIAHQTDRKHENAEIQPIDRSFVENCLNDISAFVHAIDDLINTKDRQ